MLFSGGREGVREWRRRGGDEVETRRVVRTSRVRCTFWVDGMCFT